MKRAVLRSVVWVNRWVVPSALIAAIVVGSGRVRLAAAVLLLAFWTAMYVRYRRASVRRTRLEYELLRDTRWDAFWRHYNERVPTIEQEYEIWGPYHQHRHEMRYDLVSAAARRYLPDGGRVLDLGCGSANVADRLQDRRFTYVGMDFGGPHIAYAQEKYASRPAGSTMATGFVRGDGERLPVRSASMDVVVMSEVIEHLLRPDVAVWEVARVLRPGGVFVMTTNNASEVPCYPPLTHLFAWIEKGLGASFPSLISLRPWVWPERVDRDLLPEGSPDVYLPHSHHISAQTRAMFASAGMDNVMWSTFEFPPPQSKTARWLEGRGKLGLRLVDALEAVAQRTPFIRRLGAHVFIVSRKVRDPVADRPPPQVWPGPLGATEAQGAPETSLRS